jgi:DNA-directed RNA polymerase specialized sigma24 family protein
MIDAEIHEAVMALPPDERRDGLISDLAGWRPAGSADLYGVPKATE